MSYQNYRKTNSKTLSQKTSKKTSKKKSKKNLKKTSEKSLQKKTPLKNASKKASKAFSQKLSSQKTSSKKTSTKKISAKTSNASKQAIKDSLNKNLKKPSLIQSKTNPPLLIVTGERSGDLLGGELVSALRVRGFDHFIGTGGDSMQKQKVHLLERVENMQIMGLQKALLSFRQIKLLRDKVLSNAISHGVKAAVLIDYSGFNLYLAPLLKKQGIKIIYLGSPQVWAWNYRRVYKIKKTADLMLTLLPFEKGIYDRVGVPAFWIGHPLVRRIKQRLSKEKKITVHSPKLFNYTIGVLPGSRDFEIQYLLPDMLAGIKLFSKKTKSLRIRVIIATADSKMEKFIQKCMKKHPSLSIEHYQERTLRVMEQSNSIITAAGTASLEAACMNRPMLILYRIHWFDSIIFPFLWRISYIGLPNLLARRQAAPELFQYEVTPENIAFGLKRICTDKQYRNVVSTELLFIKKNLAQGNPSAKAASYITDLIHGNG